jgi:23S rRNA (cytidine1920-2'-O)/16S rRNA (cytidine1409-2'-O)-methyltransferase
MKKNRLDLLLVERGLVESRTLAQRLIMAGQVRVDDQVVLKPSSSFDEKVSINIEQKQRFVSRGGDKLEAALVAFGLTDLQGWVCADVGASTGGFTDCLLQHGAARVYAIDVGYGELHWSLRNDERIRVMERTNARYVEKLPEPVQLVTIDASFISLRLLVPVISAWFDAKGGQAVVLIKPQFEAGKADAAKGNGVIRDVQVHYQVLLDVLGFVQGKGWQVEGVIRSPVIGSKGNVEFLAHLKSPGENVVNLPLILKPLFIELMNVDDNPVVS